MGTRVVSATEFKENCGAYLADMEKNAETITITRRRRPVAVLSPPEKPLKAKKKAWGSFANSWADKMEIVGDIVHYDITDRYDCLK